MQRLWNDPRPVGVTLMDNGDSDYNDNEDEEGEGEGKIPYCIQSSFESEQYGDEIDISWSLSLSNNNNGKENDDNDGDDDYILLPVMISGGLPRFNTTWSSSMTFCHD